MVDWDSFHDLSVDFCDLISQEKVAVQLLHRHRINLSEKNRINLKISQNIAREESTKLATNSSAKYS